MEVLVKRETITQTFLLFQLPTSDLLLSKLYPSVDYLTVLCTLRIECGALLEAQPTPSIQSNPALLRLTSESVYCWKRGK